MFAQKHLKKWLITALAVETLCVTYALKIPALTAASSVIYFITGISIAILITYMNPTKWSPRKRPVLYARNNFYRLFVLCILAVVMFYQASYWLRTVQVDIEY